MSTFSAAQGRSVVAADTAETLGEIKSFVVDPTASRIDAVHVSGRGERAQIVPWSAITSFGDDAVIAEAAHVAEQVSTEREAEAAKGKIAALGVRVLDTNGFELGTADDVAFDVDTGELTGVHTGQGPVDAGRLRALGSYALIVDPAA